MNLPKMNGTLVLRTDFSDDRAWEAVCDELRRSDCEGFVEKYDCVSDPAWENFPHERLQQFTAPPYFYLVVDAETIANPEHPVLAVDLNPYNGNDKRMFRLVPAQATSFACNLNISNMDFDDFAYNADADGIFRGFRD